MLPKWSKRRKSHQPSMLMQGKTEARWRNDGAGNRPMVNNNSKAYVVQPLFGSTIRFP